MTNSIATNPPYADSGDYTWEEDSHFDKPVRYSSLVKMVYDLKNELAAVESQLVDLKEENRKLIAKLNRWTADS